MKSDGLVIVGGSYGAVEIASSARDNGFDGRILLVSEEADLPYHRPPLSKGFLLGTSEQPELSLRSEAFYQKNDVEPLLGSRVMEINRHDQKIVLANGTTVAYEKLALALGSRPKQWQLLKSLNGIFTLRTLADARLIRAFLPNVADVVIIGGGFIGLEIGSTLARLGRRVTVIEAQNRLLARAASAPLSSFLADAHRIHGVRLLFNQSVSEITGDSGRVRSVTSNGAKFPADLVVVGIGVNPNMEIAAASGLRCANGIAVDCYTRTEDPNVFATGDCTFHPNVYAGRPLRLESVQNAIDQGKITGGMVCGRAKRYEEVPWFWSDQYDLKVQMVGLPQEYDNFAVRGSMEGGRFSIFYFKNNRLVAVDSVNKPADHMIGRKLLGIGTLLTADQARDQDFDLRSAVRIQEKHDLSPAAP